MSSTHRSLRAHLDTAAAREAVYQLRAAHVALLAGTDGANPGTAHGASPRRELELLVKAELTTKGVAWVTPLL